MTQAVRIVRGDPIPTARLTLRPPSLDDLGALLAYRDRSDIEPAFRLDAAGARDLLESQAGLSITETGGWLMFALEHRATGVMMGDVGMFVAPRDGSWADLGWWLHPDWRGRGLATEAAHALLAFAFRRAGVRRVTASCDADNLASARIMQRIGLVRDGSLRRSGWRGGVWRDVWSTALTADRWSGMG